MSEMNGAAPTCWKCQGTRVNKQIHYDGDVVCWSCGAGPRPPQLAPLDEQPNGHRNGYRPNAADRTEARLLLLLEDGPLTRRAARRHFGRTPAREILAAFERLEEAGMVLRRTVVSRSGWAIPEWALAEGNNSQRTKGQR